jgi:hypothetical protein
VARRCPRCVLRRWSGHVAPVLGLWGALVCEAGAYWRTCEWEGRAEGCEGCKERNWLEL